MGEVDQFARFASLLTTESGSSLILEPWELEVVADIFSVMETLCLLPKGNGKTALFAALALYHVTTTPNANAYVAAASRDQASLLYGYAHGYLNRSTDLQARLLARPGYREIRSRRNGDLAFLKVLASDADTADGVAPTLALVDELHRHRNGNLYAAMRDGLGKRGGRLVTISTAGWDETNSPLGKLRRAALSLPDVERHGSHTVARSAAFVMHEFAVPEGADTDDLEVVKQANPSSFVTLEDLKARHDSPSMRPEDWLRFACNIWTAGEFGWLPPGSWTACAAENREISEGARVVLGFDGSFSGDSTALVVAEIGDTPHVDLLGLWEAPDSDANWRAPRLEIMDAMREFCRYWRVQEIACDPYIWQSDLQILADEGLPVVEFPQAAGRMIPATQRFYELVNAGQVTHSNDPDLARHIGNAVARTDSRGTRITKDSKGSKRKIDAAVAAVMAVDRACVLSSQGMGYGVVSLQETAERLIAEAAERGEHLAMRGF